jgi:hypothetical protein
MKTKAYGIISAGVPPSVANAVAKVASLEASMKFAGSSSCAVNVKE